MRYAVVIEKADGNYSAYVPDLPGCIAIGETVAEVGARDSRGHPLSHRGLAVPEPTSMAEYVEA